MLTILGTSGPNTGFCDRVSRRGFLKIGGAAMGGIALNQILEMEASAGIVSSHKAIINVYLPGGPPHIDMWDLKPNAPAEIRGDFKPINTNVPGIQICEMFPKIAAMMDKFVIIRTLSDSDGDHDGYQCMTGRKRRDRGPSDGWPTAGAWVSRLGGKADLAVPANMALMYQTGQPHWGDPGTAGFLGSKHNPFNVVGRKAREKSDNMVLHGITLERLRDRDLLRKALDQFRRDADPYGRMEACDAYMQQALGILTDFEAWRRPGPVEGRPEDSRALRQERRSVSTRRRPADGGELLHRAAAGRSRRSLRVDELQPLGLARRRRHELRPSPRGFPAARFRACRPS